MDGWWNDLPPQVIGVRFCRVLVINLSGEASGACAPPRTTMPLTVPSPLSKGTRLPERPHHYVSGVEGVVEIESQWTARKRNPLGMGLRPV